MNIAICDDEQYYRNAIESAIIHWAQNSHHEDAVMIRSFSSGEDLLEAWNHGLQIDMLFLDIQIPQELSGMEVAKTIFEKDEHIPIAFVTNYSEYACEGYRVNALRYILKPVEQKAIDDCMNIAWHHWALAQTESIRIDTEKQTVLLPIQDIVCIESFDHQLLIHSVSNSPLEVRGRISDYEDILPNSLFARCHRSYIANVSYVRRLQKDSLMLAGGKVVPIGRKYSPAFIKLFNQYFQGR